MPEIPTAVWVFSVVCALFFAWAGRQPNAPFFTRLPWIIMDHVIPERPRPDYARIERLERELGMVEKERLPVIRTARVCLTKDCRGETTTVETWGGHTVFQVHRCER